MAEQFLYEQLDTLSQWGSIKKNMPQVVTQNLNKKYELRPYQIEAFARFFHCYHSEYPHKKLPLHFLFNMATGSGKTLIMAGLILYLYDQGYRNFLFFVNSTNIIEKTKDNFLNPASNKYLFAEDIIFGSHRVRLSQVDNFEATNPNDINICFTTIQKLHSDLTTEKENAITFADFHKHNIVLIADEAHHINARTKAQTELFDSWENTIEHIFTQNEDNLLLEFTATHDYATPAMVEKYRNKVIIRYDLLQFRNDLFSKDVVIVQSDVEQQDRILQALILSQYKQEVAAKYRINLKPVILFKAQRTIEQSKQLKEAFHHLIDHFIVNDIERIRKANTIPQLQRAFLFFHDNGMSDEQLAERLKREFQADYCLSVNDEGEKEHHQILVNTLEDKTNRIRAIFAVQKLNEGWDVLNLFDIVRCYEARDTGKGKIGTTTLSEAQLIGRGARYFPFVLPQGNNRFRRKFDGDLEHELRILEELHYHSLNDSRYIAEIRQALIEQGLMDDCEVPCELTFKDSFKKSKFYNYGVVWLNEKRQKDYKNIRSFADLGVKKRNYIHCIATGQGGATIALDNGKKGGVIKEEGRKDVKVNNIERNIVQSALARNPFFNLSTLNRYFPHITSIRDLIASEDYLGGLEITFQGNLYGLEENRPEKLAAMLGLLCQIEAEINSNVTDFEGTRNFKHHPIKHVFKEKMLKFDAKNPRAAHDEQFTHFVSAKGWFAFNTLYGTSEEKAFVRMLDRHIEKLKLQYEQIYLLRNEGHFALYNFSDGQAFQPDFVLFLRQKEGDMIIYQLFIEPKGRHIKEHDRWKESFLKEITSDFGGKTLMLENKKYHLIGVPFYNTEDENKFRESLESVLN